MQNQASAGRLSKCLPGMHRFSGGVGVGGWWGGLSQPTGTSDCQDFSVKSCWSTLTPNWGHSPRLQKLWVFPTFSQLNFPLHVGETRGHCPTFLFQSESTTYGSKAGFSAILQLGLAEGSLGEAGSRQGHSFLLFSLESPAIFHE